MEEKIYDRQVTKQSLANRVVDQQQIERHFTLNELTELYMFKPDLLDPSASGQSNRNTLAMPQVRTAGGFPHLWPREFLKCLCPLSGFPAGAAAANLRRADCVFSRARLSAGPQRGRGAERGRAQSCLGRVRGRGKQPGAGSRSDPAARWRNCQRSKVESARRSLSVLAPQSLLATRPGNDNPNLNLTSKTNEELLVKNEDLFFSFACSSKQPPVNAVCCLFPSCIILRVWRSTGRRCSIKPEPTCRWPSSGCRRSVRTPCRTTWRMW